MNQYLSLKKTTIAEYLPNHWGYCMVSDEVFNWYLYETLSKLMDFLKQEDLSELINLKNNNRKIGPKISNRLKEYLLS